MADLHTYRKLPSDPCLSEEKILAYIDGNLSAAEQHACETHMADCAMCEDAVEGLALVKDRSMLATPLKTDTAPAEGKVVPLHHPNRKVWYAVAAVLVIILGSTFMLKIISSDEAESKDVAYNSEVQMDSLSAAPGEGYRDADKSLANEEIPDNTVADAQDKKSLNAPKESYKVTVTDANNAGPTEEALAPPVPAEAEEDIFLQQERVVADEMQEGDNDGRVVVQTKPEAITLKDKTEVADDSKEEQKAEKKNKLFDFGAGVAGGTKRAETSTRTKQDGYVDNNRDDVNQNAPAVNNPVVVGNTNTQPQAPQAAGASGGVFDIPTDVAPADSNAVLLSETTTIASQDSIVAIDQLELSYQNGVNLLNAGQTSNAIVMFDKVLTNKNHVRFEDAEFQKAKALIKANRKDEAKVLLKAIETKKGKHAAAATELLKTL